MVTTRIHSAVYARTVLRKDGSLANAEIAAESCGAPNCRQTLEYELKYAPILTWAATIANK